MENFTMQQLKEECNKKIKGKQKIIKFKYISYFDDENRPIYSFIIARLDRIVSGIGEEKVRCVRVDGRYFTIGSSNIRMVEELFLMPTKKFQKIQLTAVSKAPKTKARHVGIEIEFISKLNKEQLMEMLSAADLEKYVELKDDGSIDTDDEYKFAHELCICVNEAKMPKIVDKVCKIIMPHSTVNKTCGLHVHLDMRNRNKEKAYKALFAAQALLYSMVPKSRIENNYCKPRKKYHSFAEGEPNLDEDSFCGDEDCQVCNHESSNQCDPDNYGDRYYGLNKSAFSRHKTIEIRIHSGSVNAHKIVSWVRLLIKIANSSVKEAKIIKSKKEAKRAFKLGVKLSRYVDERLKTFEDDKRDEFKIGA